MRDNCQRKYEALLESLLTKREHEIKADLEPFFLSLNLNVIVQLRTACSRILIFFYAPLKL